VRSGGAPSSSQGPARSGRSLTLSASGGSTSNRATEGGEYDAAEVRASSVLTPAQIGMLVVGYVLLAVLSYLYLASGLVVPARPGCGGFGR
jgi:hypothetical protein